MAVFDRVKNTARKVLASASNSAASSLDALLQVELSKQLARLQAEVRATMPDNPAAWSFKVYSQADEDGIDEEVVRRIGIADGHFIEIGCGDGVPATRVHEIVKERRAITADTAARLAKYFGGDAASWLVMQANYDLKTLPTLRDIERQVPVREQLKA